MQTDSLAAWYGALREAARDAYPEKAEKLVFGEGQIKPALMLVGEAPGAQEEKLGRPFVGKAGENLDRFLELSGLKREEIYISNVVKYRPDRLSDSGRLVNRTPTGREIEWFRPWLLEEIRRVSPSVVATLGNTALHALAGNDVNIGDVHGRLLHTDTLSCPLFALYHPASIIYNRSLEPVYEEDVRTLAAQLGGN